VQPLSKHQLPASLTKSPEPVAWTTYC
jgi:hypothetical protein